MDSTLKLGIPKFYGERPHRFRQGKPCTGEVANSIIRCCLVDSAAGPP